MPKLTRQQEKAMFAKQNKGNIRSSVSPKFVNLGKNQFFSKQGKITRLNIATKNGRTLSLFYNKENNLFVADVVRKDSKGGNEFVRKKLDDIDTSLPEDKKPKQKKFNELNSMIAWEEGRLNGKDTIRLFQHLEDTGRAYSLQGTYGRTAVAMIGAGLIKPNKKIHSPEQIKSYKQQQQIRRAFNDF